MSEVSCRAYNFLIRAEKEGVLDIDRCIHGLPITRDFLKDPSNRMSWDVWLSITDRVEEQLGSRQALINSGRFSVHENYGGKRFTQSLMKLVAEPADLYRAVWGFSIPNNYRCIETEYKKLSGGHLQLKAHIKPGYQGSEGWFLTALGALPLVPSFLDYEEAVVLKHTITPRSIDVHLKVPVSNRFFSRTRRVAEMIWSPKALLSELEFQQQQLSDSYDAMQKNEAEFRRAFEALPVLVVFHREGFVVYANPAMCRTLGYEKGGMIGLALSDIVGGGGSAKIAEADKEALLSLKLRARDGRELSVEIRVEENVIQGGEACAAIYATDVSDREQARNTIEALLRSSHDLILRVNVRGEVLDMQGGNGFTLNASAGLGSANVSAGLDSANISDSLGSANVSDGLGFANISGSLGSANVSDGLGFANISGSLGSANISDSLGSANISDSLGSANISDGLGSVNVSDGLGSANTSQGGPSNVTAVLARIPGVSAQVANETWQTIRKAILNSERTPKLVLGVGERFFDCQLLLDIHETALLTIRDVSELRNHEREIAQADRLISLGTLVAGVGHEINNPLAYVVGNAEYLEEEFVNEDALSRQEVVEALGEIVEGAGRISKIVSSLRRFSRVQHTSIEAVNVERVIESAIRIASPQLGPSVSIVRQYEDPPSALADSSQLEQVVLNLLVNAAQAKQESRNLIITLSTNCEAAHTRIVVNDNGSGIAPLMLSHVFDAFYTTKKIGEGTGLGLSIAHRIVESAGGTLSVTSELGQGSSFVVSLPSASVQ